MKKALLITLLSIASCWGVFASVCYVDTTLNVGICTGEWYTFADSVFTSTGTHYDTLMASGGCDSVIILNLTVYPVYRDTTVKTICSGQTFGGYTATGIYTDTLTTINGCDSIVVLNLTVTPPVTYVYAQAICGGSYQGHNLTGVYIDTLQTTTGCDSIVTLILTVKPIQQTTITASVCSGETYLFGDSLLTITGTYTRVFTAIDGCDSTVTLNLTILPVPIQPYITRQGDTLVSGNLNGNQWFLNDSVLAGDTLGILFTMQDGNYQVQVTGPNGCQNISAAYIYYGTGINVVENAFQVSVYPNPNTGNFVVQFGDNNLKEVLFTNMLGQTVLPARQCAIKCEVNLTGLASGIYLMRIADMQDAGKVVFRQLVIEH